MLTSFTIIYQLMDLKGTKPALEILQKIFIYRNESKIEILKFGGGLFKPSRYNDFSSN